MTPVSSVYVHFSVHMVNPQYHHLVAGDTLDSYLNSSQSCVYEGYGANVMFQIHIDFIPTEPNSFIRVLPWKNIVISPVLR